MRVLGLVLAGALALTASVGVQAGSLGPGSYSMPNGWNGDWRRVPSPLRQWNGGSVSWRWWPNGPPGARACCPGPGVPTYWVREAPPRAGPREDGTFRGFYGRYGRKCLSRQLYWGPNLRPQWEQDEFGPLRETSLLGVPSSADTRV
jgi:hypothetical protein